MVVISRLDRFEGKEITLKGWVYNTRSSKSLHFVEMRDGTGLCQVIFAKEELPDSIWESALKLRRESSIEVTGRVVRDERSDGGYELHASGLAVIQIAEEYPITPKEHGVEFLMENRHLWLRSRRQWAAMRVRNALVFAIHRFFQEREFLQLDAPIFTSNAAEGTTTLFETDYFDEKAFLTQSGQLYGEAMAMAHGKIYTFGPTFRAEKSKTRRHLTEFWMVEPEMAFFDLQMTMDLAEEMIGEIVKTVLKECRAELEILERDTAPLESIVSKSFQRLAYGDAVDLLRSDGTGELLERMGSERETERGSLEQEADGLRSEHGSAKKWRKAAIDRRLQEIHARLDQIAEDLRNIPVWQASAAGFEWGNDFGGSDETLLTMQFDTPLLIHRYPAAVKAFYMKRDPDDDRLALAMDLLAPEGYGEIIGGSQREDDLETLRKRISEHRLPEEAFSWYLDLRRYGSVPHSGFGLGIERTLAWICGLSHVRETIPFPRMPGRLTP